MQSRISVVFLFALVAWCARPASAQQPPARPAEESRTRSQEMRDKAEASLYRKHDCRTALLQANAGFKREMLHPERMDPRLPLVKARAHECLGQNAEAVLSYAMYDRLAGIANTDDTALQGVCNSLLPDGGPAEPAELARLNDSLTTVRSQVQRARNANAFELRLRTGMSSEVQSGSLARGTPTEAPMDQGTITRDMGNETMRVMRQSWFAPSETRVTQYYRRSLDRTGDTGQRLASTLADVEAQLLCLNPSR